MTASPEPDHGSHRLLLLRHGEVESHRGDVPITAAGAETARQAGLSLARDVEGLISVLSGDTRRARETAEALVDGLRSGGAQVSGPRVAFALRNPDLYLAGLRVDMVSSEEALAEQVEGLTADEVTRLSFYPQFIVSPDRIGWWLRHESPPGEDAAGVAARIRHFATSLLDIATARPALTVAVTHSPLVRAAALDLLGHDIGEPAWVSGLDLTLRSDGTLTGDLYGGSGGIT